jgi:hypothetical protein
MTYFLRSAKIGSPLTIRQPQHPASVAVFLTENHGRFTFPDGKTEERSWKAGQSMVMPPENDLPENLNDKPLELVLIELK